MADTYSGFGYPGNIDTLGNQPIQDYLNYKGEPVDTSFGFLPHVETTRLSGFGDATMLFSNFLTDVGTPKTLEELIVNFRIYVYTNLPSPTFSGTVAEKMAQAKAWLSDPANGRTDELDPNAFMTLDFLSQNFLESTGIIAQDWLVYAGANPPNKISTLMTNDPTSALDFGKMLLTTSYADFMEGFTYQSTTGLMNQLIEGYKTYLQDFIKAYSSGLDSTAQISYENFFKGYFDNGDFEKFFADFVAKAVNEQGSFTPTQLFDKWTVEILNNYALVNPNSAATAPLSVSAGAQKTLILNRIFKLLVLMIESLQKVAAAQSDRLALFSKWQKAYTDLQNSIKYFLADGKDVVPAILSDADRRNNLNSFNASLTETIKARKSVLGDDAKNLQTQINQSNDAVNQQTSMATSILQELATILAALYR